jgi:hypothetical protein
VHVGDDGRAVDADHGAAGCAQGDVHHRPVLGDVDVLAGEQLGALDKAAIAAHRVVHRQAVAVADDVVLQAMTGGGVHGAGAGLQGDVLAEDDRHLAVVEGVL